MEKIMISKPALSMKRKVYEQCVPPDINVQIGNLVSHKRTGEKIMKCTKKNGGKMLVLNGKIQSEDNN